MIQGSTVALFLSHEMSQETIRAFQHLRDTAGPEVTVRWLLDVSRNPAIPPELAASVTSYDSRRFAEWGLSTFGPKMLPGHCHYPVLKYFRENPGISWLWTVEYDVRFTGPWHRLFGHFRDDASDLLTCHLRDRYQEPGWSWWDSLRRPRAPATPDNVALRSFLVVARYSARALQRLIDLQGADWAGHQEVVVPTLLASSGLSVRDFNDTAAGRSPRRFYTSVTEPWGRLGPRGTVRYRPARSRAGWRRNMLYHPVKPAQMLQPRSFSSLARRVLDKILRLLGRRAVASASRPVSAAAATAARTTPVAN